MKKTILSLTALFITASATVFAQSDSTTTPTPSQEQTIEKPAGQESASDHAYRKDDRDIVQHDKLPAALKKTLQEGDQYKGWESSTIYLDKTSKQYLVELGTAGDKRIYRFDENGKAVPGNTSVKDDQ